MTLTRRRRAIVRTHTVGAAIIGSQTNAPEPEIERLARLSRTRLHERSVTRLKSHRGKQTLAGAASRAPELDLDAAWTFALRGDLEQAWSRLAGYVRDKAPAPEPEGTPWRGEGWLSRRRR